MNFTDQEKDSMLEEEGLMTQAEVEEVQVEEQKEEESSSEEQKESSSLDEKIDSLIAKVDELTTLIASFKNVAKQEETISNEEAKEIADIEGAIGF